MNIGEAAAASGVSAKMIRYYEQTGLIPNASRAATGYREYSGGDIQILRFVRRARDLGFSIAEIEELIRLWRDETLQTAEVRQVARTHIETLGRKITELQDMANALNRLVRACETRHRPPEQCAVSSSIAEAGGADPEATAVPV